MAWEFQAKKKYNALTRPVWTLFQAAALRTCPAGPAGSAGPAGPASGQGSGPAPGPAPGQGKGQGKGHSKGQSHSKGQGQGQGQGQGNGDVGAPLLLQRVDTDGPRPSPELHDHLSDPPPRLARKVLKWRNGSSFLQPVLPVHSASPRTLLIYQRDRSRRLLRAPELAERLRRRLGPAGWEVLLLTHSPQRAPCDLVGILRRSVVLLTPHGFQSVLLLFQPLHSLLVELHPSLYFKPEVFGLLQAGVREHLGAQRSYLSSQSELRSWYMAVLSTLLSLFPLRDAGYCTGNALCRFLARLQQVEIDARFEALVATFAQAAFVD